MSNLSHSESRRMYSWWWDSHNTPKNSKWLQDNLTDIDGKVKSMIKLIEEDADSFARRAEMYYKKRPELMKLVEEFYRAYRALAERYNHATGELRHAQQTIAKAFPDDAPFELVEDNERPGPDMPGIKHPAHALVDVDDYLENDLHGLSSSGGVPREKGLKQLPDMFGSEKTGGKNPNREDTQKPESEVQSLKKALADMKAEKETVFVQYKQCLEKLSEIERELINAQMDSTRLSEKASRAEIEVQTLKEALIQFEVEKIAEMIKQNDFLEKISRLEAVASRFEEDIKGLDRKAYKAETEAENLRSEISRLELEKETVVRKYKQCLGKISDLEKIISSNEDEAKLLSKQAEIGENEVRKLKHAFANLNKEKDDMALEYECYSGKISELEKDLSIAKNDVERLNNEVSTRNEKLKTAEKKCALMETSNRSLRIEADNLAEKIVSKDGELMRKQEELEKLQIYLKDEHSRHTQVESALESLQNLHSRSQEDQKALALELNNVVRILKEIEISKSGLEEEIQRVRVENRSLTRANLSSSVSLKEIKERLESEVSHHIGVTISLQNEILCLKEEIDGLNRSYKALVEQVEAAGLDPTCVRNSIESLRDENLRLKEKIERESVEKAILYKKVEEIEEVLKKNAVVESSLSDLSAELVVEKANLVVEKASILSQLRAMTENVKNLLRKNAVLEDSFSTAKIELQGLREKSKGLEEICELLKKERSYLLSERSTLVSKLKNAEKRINGLEKQFTGLEGKYADLEKDKKSMHRQVEKLKVSLSEEKQERKGSQIESETQLAGLENRIHLLHEENRSKKKESEEELDKSLKAQFEISILQKFIKDMEDKNCSLIIECQKHVEASRLAEKLISELEGESLEQQLESKLLLDEIERLSMSIYQIFKVLECGSDRDDDDGKVEIEQTLVNHILGSIEDLKSCVSKHEEEKRQLLVENSDLLALLEQLESRGTEIESKKVYLERESEIMAENLFIVENEKDELIEINRHLKTDAIKGRREAAVFRAELESLCVKHADLREAYSRANEDNAKMKKEIINGKENLNHKETKIMDTESKLGAAKKLNSDLFRTVIELENDIRELSETRENLEKNISELSEKSCSRQKEIESLRAINVNLESELREMNNEFELWETEASTFCFDLQVSSINEFLLKDKVRELSGICEILEHKHEEKVSEIEQTKEKVCLMENEVTGLKARLYAYEQVIASLRDDISILEQNASLHVKPKAGHSREAELSEVVDYPSQDTFQILQDDTSLSSLQNLRMRVKVVGKLIEEANKPVSEGRSNSDRISTVKIDQLKPRRSLVMKKRYAKSAEVRNGTTLTKDIPLDRASDNSSRRRTPKKGKSRSDDLMLELWETAEDENTDSTVNESLEMSYKSMAERGKVAYDRHENIKGESLLPLTDSDVENELSVDKLELLSTRKVEHDWEVNDAEILEKLASDAEKLEILETNLRDLRIKMEKNNKMSRKGKNVNFQMVREQFQEAEDSVVHLVDLNGQLVKNIESYPKDEMEETLRTWRIKVIEQAEKGSERIDRLQLAIQRIQYALSKIETEKNNKGKNKFLRSKTIILRDFVDYGRKNSGKRKKGPRWGCFRQSTSGNANGS